MLDSDSVLMSPDHGFRESVFVGDNGRVKPDLATKKNIMSPKIIIWIIIDV